MSTTTRRNFLRSLAGTGAAVAVTVPPAFGALAPAARSATTPQPPLTPAPQKLIRDLSNLVHAMSLAVELLETIVELPDKLPDGKKPFNGDFERYDAWEVYNGVRLFLRLLQAELDARYRGAPLPEPAIIATIRDFKEDSERWHYTPDGQKAEMALSLALCYYNHAIHTYYQGINRVELVDALDELTLVLDTHLDRYRGTVSNATLCFEGSEVLDALLAGREPPPFSHSLLAIS